MRSRSRKPSRLLDWKIKLLVSLATVRSWFKKE